jgi:hypothetical protein
MRFEVMMVLICRMLAAGNAAASMLEAVQSTAEYEEVAKAALQVRTCSPCALLPPRVSNRGNRRAQQAFFPFFSRALEHVSPNSLLKQHIVNSGYYYFYYHY